MFGSTDFLHLMSQPGLLQLIHDILNMTSESLLCCLHVFNLFSLQSEKSWTHICVLLLWMWPTLSSCTRGNIISDNLKQWRPDVIFKTYYHLVSNQSGQDSRITPSLHFPHWSSQKKHWVKIQDLAPTVQVLISLGCRIWKAGQNCRIMTGADNFCSLVTYNF